MLLLRRSPVQHSRGRGLRLSQPHRLLGVQCMRVVDAVVLISEGLMGGVRSEACGSKRRRKKGGGRRGEGADI